MNRKEDSSTFLHKKYNVNYYYQCFTCKKKWNAEFIEKNDHHLCPDCIKKNNKGMPLRGILQIFYDYLKLRDIYTKDFFQKIEPGNIFRYPFLLPLNNKRNFSLFENLHLPSNNLRKINNNNNKHELYLMDETHNPTFSFKDRASILVAAKSIENNRNTICTASTGNAASSMAGICAQLGLTAKIFVPENIPTEKLIQIRIYGAEVEKIKGGYDDAYDIAIKESMKNNWYNRNTAFNPLTIEGKKSAAFDIFMQLHFDLPDKIFVPCGDGVIISGIYKGFYDLYKLAIINRIPQLIAVQAQGSSAIIDYLQSKHFVLAKGYTIADSIFVNNPRNLYLAVDCIERSNGFGIKVSDREILRAEKYIGNEFGIFAEPSAAAAWVGYKKYLEKENKKEKIVVVLTGCGFKDSKKAIKALNL